MRRLILVAIGTFLGLPLFGGLSSDGGEPREREANKPTAKRISISVLTEVLDAVQSELLLSGVCQGGEDIELWLTTSELDDRTLELVYRISGILHICREAYVQKDGTVLLAGELRFRDGQTRYWIQKVDERVLAELDSYAMFIPAKLAQSLTRDQMDRNARRLKLAQDSKNRP